MKTHKFAYLVAACRDVSGIGEGKVLVLLVEICLNVYSCVSLCVCVVDCCDIVGSYSTIVES